MAHGHAGRALRDVAWAHGRDVVGRQHPDETHEFPSEASVRDAWDAWAAVLPHAPLPPRWRLEVRIEPTSQAAWEVVLVDDAGAVVARL